MPGQIQDTTDRITGVARDPLRAFRVPDELWLAAVALARKRGEHVSAILRKALEDYLRKHDQ